MKRFRGKYDKLFEDTIYRFQSGGLSVGDIVKIRKDALTNEKVKALTQTYQEQLRNAIETDLNLRVAAVKSIRPNTTQNYGGIGTDAPYDFHVDLVIEYAPGLWRDPITVPIEVLDRFDCGANLPPVPDSLKRKNPENKPTELEIQDANRKNPTQNTPLKAPKAQDGRDQIQKPIEMGESLENIVENLFNKGFKTNNVDEAVETYLVTLSQPYGGLPPELFRSKFKELFGSNIDLELRDPKGKEFYAIIVNEDDLPFEPREVEKRLAPIVQGTVNVLASNQIPRQAPNNEF